LYAAFFDKVGYVISTILFLEGELFLFNGLKNWKVNTMVSVIFSLVIYILFSKLLGVYLPMTPGIWI
jgi:putative tricarboxylic transport membrane protein